MPQPPARRIVASLGVLLATLLNAAPILAAEDSGRGFSTDRQASGVRGFDRPGGRSAGKTDREITDKNREWARAVLKRQDDDGDGYLVRSETRRWDRLARFDHDSDNRISLEELAAYSSGKPLPKRKTREAAPAAEADGRRSQRLWTATDKLPEGLPSWFADKDADADGQVAMHEYSRRWDARAVRKFAELDQNDDGLITPAEALPQKK